MGSNATALALNFILHAGVKTLCAVNPGGHSYGHPHEEALKKHVSAGWRQIVTTAGFKGVARADRALRIIEAAKSCPKAHRVSRRRCDMVVSAAPANAPSEAAE
jgi:hypothetical protein